MPAFQTIDPYTLEGNIFKMLDKDWMLLTAGNSEAYNTMTASWGGFGILWNRTICFTFIRPQRYTFEFAERNDQFTLSFFNGNYRKALNHLGTVSGRNRDKISESGLVPYILPSGSVGFEEAGLIFDCRKIYFNDLQSEHFLDPRIESLYKNQDYHRMYIGEIKTILKSE